MNQLVQHFQLLSEFRDQFLFLQSLEVLRVKKRIKDAAYKGHLGERLNSLESFASEPGINTVMRPHLISDDSETLTVPTTLQLSFLLKFL